MLKLQELIRKNMVSSINQLLVLYVVDIDDKKDGFLM